MTSAPADLLAFRATVMRLTGLTDPAAVGIVGDGAHQRTGGYHEGVDVLEGIGRYHPPASGHVGSDSEDYSVRTARDRRGLSASASAMDIGYRWPHGGYTAWLKFNRLLVAALPRDPALGAIRGVNYSPDGTAKCRVDREAGFRVTSSTDTVDVHTHIEWYRDTEGKRAVCLARLADLITQAIIGKTPDVQEDFMAGITDTDQLVLIWNVDALVHGRATIAGGPFKGKPVEAWETIAEAVVAKLPPASTGGLTVDQVQTAAKSAIAEVLTGGTAAVSATS